MTNKFYCPACFSGHCENHGAPGTDIVDELWCDCDADHEVLKKSALN